MDGRVKASEHDAAHRKEVGTRGYILVSVLSEPLLVCGMRVTSW